MDSVILWIGRRLVAHWMWYVVVGVLCMASAGLGALVFGQDYKQRIAA